jgi:type II secretory pathway component PulF
MKRMKSIKWIIALMVLLAACQSGSADKKVPQLANEMCDCFTRFQASLTPEGRSLLKAVSVSGNPQADLISGMSELKPGDALEFSKKMSSMADKTSELYKCMEAFDKKHGKETTKDKKALTEKLLSEMQGKTDCPAGAAIINLSLAREKKSIAN